MSWPQYALAFKRAAGLICGCSGDKKVIEAIELMNTEGISSLAVVDNQYNVLGNISTTDVKVGNVASLPSRKHNFNSYYSI